MCSLLLFQGQHKQGSTMSGWAVTGSSGWWGWQSRLPWPLAVITLCYFPVGNRTLQSFAFFSLCISSFLFPLLLPPLFSFPLPEQSSQCPSYLGEQFMLVAQREIYNWFSFCFSQLDLLPPDIFNLATFVDCLLLILLMLTSSTQLKCASHKDKRNVSDKQLGWAK